MYNALLKKKAGRNNQGMNTGIVTHSSGHQKKRSYPFDGMGVGRLQGRRTNVFIFSFLHEPGDTNIEKHALRDQ